MSELVCLPCAEVRESGSPVEVESLCQQCFEYATTEVGYPDGMRGKPGICVRPEPFNSALTRTPLPSDVGRIVDIAAVNDGQRSLWLILAEDGALIQFDADTVEWVRVASAGVQLEPDHKPWNGHGLRRRLHSSQRGEFAAVVNDYGRHGQVIDLRNGRVTMALHGGDYHPETVPFSFAFADLQGRTLAIHRTAWNRLDVSDPSTGELITRRGPTSYRSGEEKPEHYLDYFHGGLYLSPQTEHVLDDGWVWHPVGIPSVWSVERWISENVWESEDGPTRLALWGRNYYWNGAMTWLDEKRVAIGGIGDDDDAMIEGAMIFDITSSGRPGGGLRADFSGARPVTAFAGPAGAFFSDGICLFSSDRTGLSRWDPEDGALTWRLEDFHPTHYHSNAGELVQLADGVLVRWSIAE